MKDRKPKTTAVEKARQIRIKVHRAQQVLEKGYSELREAEKRAGDLGLVAVEFRKTMATLLDQLDTLTSKPSLAADALENDVHSVGPDRINAAELIVEGGEVPEPDAHALGQLLDLVEGGSSEALDFENELSKLAFVWLMRQHPPAVEQIRKLAEIAGKINSDHIRWAGKTVD